MTTPLIELLSVMLKSLSPSQESELVGDKTVGYLQRVVSLRMGSPWTNSFNSSSSGFEPRSSVFKSQALTTEPRCLSNYDNNFLYANFVFAKKHQWPTDLPITKIGLQLAVDEKTWTLYTNQDIKRQIVIFRVFIKCKRKLEQII